MLESTESLLPTPNPGEVLPVLCVGEHEESLDELDRLLQTLGVSPIGRVTIAPRTISPATYVGSGKLDQIRLKAEEIGAASIIFDVELSPNQLRNVEKALDNKPVLDRPGVIIEIFSRHARTKEAKTQVELARLQYLYPRLAHFWTHFERQRGGGVNARGMGEKQVEVDRRLVKDRMRILRERLKGIEKERKVQRAGREDLLKVALVGYTNAGKSTLLNALTQSGVRTEDKLFATLDSSVRTLDPNSHPPVVAIDTVGFIRNLPHTLVASFRSTLEELHQADLLLHVVDASSKQAREELEVTSEVLRELGVADKPRVVVLNKADRLDQPLQRVQAKVIAPGALLISAHRPEDVQKLRDHLLEHFKGRMEVWDVLIPYSDSRMESKLYTHGSVETVRHLEKGTFYRVRVKEEWARKLDLARYRL